MSGGSMRILVDGCVIGYQWWRIIDIIVILIIGRLIMISVIMIVIIMINFEIVGYLLISQ